MEIFGLHVDKNFVVACLIVSLLISALIFIMVEQFRQVGKAFSVKEIIDKNIKKFPELESAWDEFTTKINGVTLHKYYLIGKIFEKYKTPITVINIMKLPNLPNIGDTKWLFKKVKI